MFISCAHCVHFSCFVLYWYILNIWKHHFRSALKKSPVDILILSRCRSDIALDIAMTLLMYYKWNTWWCQFAISIWHQDLDIGPIRLLMSSWHCHYPAERNPSGSCTTSVSATVMARLYSGNWKLKLQGTFFSVTATKNLKNIFKQRYFT